MASVSSTSAFPQSTEQFNSMDEARKWGEENVKNTDGSKKDFAVAQSGSGSVYENGKQAGAIINPPQIIF
ncbi:hypothetical protein LVW35_07715 [Pseudomonas sp. HN11]|uniref:hypothetical protein n=1 Tax=Pseudomonas sp. HN11 TaxID=1344094 RepID=UPI001F1C9619|nr:hypothetical protein [Pseudomonas sp. HN11]UII73054.1 hypothetical protein LVW35_07715 [Pseudomonas sp. HN11]